MPIADGRKCSALLQFNEQGIYCRRYVPLEGRPWDVEAVSDTRIFVAHHERKCITITDLNTEEKQTIGMNGKCYDITYNGDNIYVIFRPLGIVSLDSKKKL